MNKKDGLIIPMTLYLCIINMGPKTYCPSGTYNSWTPPKTLEFKVFGLHVFNK